MTFADKVKQLMGGLSYKEASLKSGIAHDKIWRWVKLGQKASANDARAFAEAFGVPTMYLVDDKMETAHGNAEGVALSADRILIEKHIKALTEERAQRILAAARERIEMETSPIRAETSDEFTARRDEHDSKRKRKGRPPGKGASTLNESPGGVRAGNDFQAS